MENFLSDIATSISVIKGCYILKKRLKLSKQENKLLDGYLLSNVKIVEKALSRLLRYSVS